MQTGLESAPKETDNCSSSKDAQRGDLRATQWDMRTRPKASRISLQRTPPTSATTSNNPIVIHPVPLTIDETVKHTGLTMELDRIIGL